MEDPIPISLINDFIFCPVSIYFHNLYGDLDKILYQNEDQIRGRHSHITVDESQYSSRKDVLQGVMVYSKKYNLYGRIDCFEDKSGILTERKKKITNIYDGYIFQLYAQCFALREMNYKVKTIRFYSMDDNRVYKQTLPEKNKNMFMKFERAITSLQRFNIEGFKQTNISKCVRCIYEPACDRSKMC